VSFSCPERRKGKKGPPPFGARSPLTPAPAGAVCTAVQSFFLLASPRTREQRQDSHLGHSHFHHHVSPLRCVGDSRACCRLENSVLAEIRRNFRNWPRWIFLSRTLRLQLYATAELSALGFSAHFATTRRHQPILRQYGFVHTLTGFLRAGNTFSPHFVFI
jgi:hypothetical protein